ncbi:glycogen synthase GlgA [bacterium]|nr:glycogen synthase GlgA [bacterium]
MKNRLNILMVFSEVAPFSKTGGLGDVGGALPKVLKDMGHDVRVITPQYRRINERKYVLRDVIRLQDIKVEMAGEVVSINVKSAFLPNSKVQVYFMDYRPYFFRDGLYSNPKKNEDYSDNAQRYYLFCKGTLETLKKLQWQPDVIHCNDWQTGMIPFLLQHHYRDNPFFLKVHTLMTVHNFAFQGNFNRECLSVMNLPNNFVFEDSELDLNGQCSFLKAGLLSATMVNTVSNRYAYEVKHSEDYGFGMENVLKNRSDDLKGVLNGMDSKVWNPETDPLIAEKYSIDNFSGKSVCKQALIEELGLKDNERPLVAIISRLTEQKGMHLLQDIFEEMLAIPVSFVLLGLGEKRFHEFFIKMAKKYPKQVSVHLKFDDLLAHRIIAGADLFLMPSLFEPCGLTQLYALKYGTVPVVFETGGLADTIKPFNGGSSEGNGYLFQKPISKALLKAIKQSLTHYRDAKIWRRVIRNGMKVDFSWEKSAEEYINLYQLCIDKT